MVFHLCAGMPHDPNIARGEGGGIRPGVGDVFHICELSHMPMPNSASRNRAFPLVGGGVGRFCGLRYQNEIAPVTLPLIQIKEEFSYETCR